mgnify:CR=1 FL=1
MPINFFHVVGDPNIGVFILTTDSFLITPPILTEGKTLKLVKYLGVKTYVRTRLCGSKLIGALSAANSWGIVIPDISSEDEAEQLRRGLNVDVHIISSKWTALGNAVLVNDYGGVVDHRVPEVTVWALEEALKVKLKHGTIAGLPYVGSLGVTTNRGALVHPGVRDDERRLLAETLKVPVYTGTVNGGMPYVKAGLLANSHGIVVGGNTMGLELANISHALGER